MPQQFSYDDLQAYISQATDILVMAYEEGHLEDTLINWGLYQKNFDSGEKYLLQRNPYILVVGDCQFKPKDAKSILKNYGLNKDDVVFLPYDEATNHDFIKYKGSSRVSDIFFGPTPHSAMGKGEFSSIIEMIRSNADEFPLIQELREISGGLKISRTSFKEALEHSELYRLKC